jgi:hypothetical protein
MRSPGRTPRQRGSAAPALTSRLRCGRMTIELVPLCTFDIELGDQILVGDGPSGLRVVVEVKDSTVRGERLAGRGKGQVNADWLTVNGTVGNVDVRSLIETDDGALVYVEYHGRMDLTNGPGSAPIYIAPRFETSDERYQWLNTIQAVGKGTLDGEHLSYEIAEVR